ncbi:MutS-related protein [Sciscionella marina]|uniref:MutS-related protein n=1 Tax=Sciscionella marina TaxID=508770 RepID=UPI0012F6EB8F|nr:DNA mismatch repair protein MutS [Sciscionella marina]
MRSRSVEVLGIFLEGLTNLRSLAERARHDFESDGFGELFDLFTQELSDEYLDTMRKHLRRMELRSGVQLSAALGDENQGRAYRLHMPEKQKPGWWERVTGGSATGYTFKIDERDESGARALSELRARGIENAVHALAESADHVHDFLVALRTDLAFYLGCLNLHTALTDAGAPLSFPVPRQRAELAFAARDLRDVVLLLRSGSGVVGNDVESSGRPLVIVTGANQGGKSTFLRSCGIAQLMAQAGLFVTAESLSSSVCDRIFTHYRREEDDEMESGKFDEELRRLRNITESATAASMVLFNESFAATNESEGSEIALEVLEALCAAGVRVFCVTHMYALSAALARRGTGAVTFLRADRDADGNRSFRLVAGAPRPTSHGQDLYRMIFDSAGRSP